MGTKKNLSVKKEIPQLGIVSALEFEEGRAIAKTNLNETDYKRIIASLREFVEEEFSDDDKYIEALRIVEQKLSHKHHRLIMTENIFLGTGTVLLDHVSGKKSPAFLTGK